MAARIISVHSHKGGSGKSNTCLNLAFCLHAHGIKTGIIDLDPQGSLLTMQQTMRSYDADFPFPLLTQADSYMTQDMDDDTVMFIDFQPNVSAESIKDFSHVFVVPFQPSPLDWNSAIPGIQILREHNRCVLPVLNRYKNREHRAMRTGIEEAIGTLDVIYERAYYVRCAIVNGGVWQQGIEKLARTDTGDIVKANVRDASKQEVLTLAIHAMEALHNHHPFHDASILTRLYEGLQNDEQ